MTSTWNTFSMSFSIPCLGLKHGIHQVLRARHFDMETTSVKSTTSCVMMLLRAWMLRRGSFGRGGFTKMMRLKVLPKEIEDACAMYGRFEAPWRPAPCSVIRENFWA